MAFYYEYNQQLTLSDNTLHLTEREKRVLERLWTKYFLKKFFLMLMRVFSLFFTSDKAFSPNTPVNVNHWAIQMMN